MIKEIEIPEIVKMNSWRYWRDCDSKYRRYEDWLKGEYKITIWWYSEDSTTGIKRYIATIMGEEPDLTMFLLRWSVD